MAGQISFNPLSTTSEFLKNKSDPSQPLSHIGEASITRTLNHNGPLRPLRSNGTVRLGRSAKNAMRRRNEIAETDFEHVNRNIKSKGLSNHYERGNRNLNDLAMVGMRRSRVRNQQNAEDTGLLLENNLHQESLNIAPVLRYATGKTLKAAPARGALRGSRNKAILRNAEALVKRAKNALAANTNPNSDEHLQLKDAYANAKAKLNSLKVGGSKRNIRSKNRNGTARH